MPHINSDPESQALQCKPREVSIGALLNTYTILGVPYYSYFNIPRLLNTYTILGVPYYRYFDIPQISKPVSNY